MARRTLVAPISLKMRRRISALLDTLLENEITTPAVLVLSVPAPGPVGPVTPLEPDGPVGLMTPVEPDEPDGPDGPVAPVFPCGPTGP